MGVCTPNMSSQEFINKITYLHQVGIPHYFIKQLPFLFHGFSVHRKCCVKKLKDTPSVMDHLLFCGARTLLDLSNHFPDFDKFWYL